MPRRLVNRTAASSTVRSTPTAVGDTSLPEYQPPSCHHSASHRLTDLPASRVANAASAQLTRQIQDAGRNLGHSADDLQARLRERRAKLEQIRERREERGTEKTAEEERMEEHVKMLEGVVRSLTNKSEEAMRAMVDLRADREDVAQVLKDLETEVATRIPPPANEGEDASTIEPPTDGPLSVYQSLREKKTDEYMALTPHQRYALDNEYATFKKLWHLGLVGEDGPPLPDASRWFDARGNPVMSSGGAANGSFDSATVAGDAAGGAGHEELDDDRDNDDDDDDEIAVAREVVSLVCPLTQTVMKEPYSNRRCKHTFEKEAIRHHLRVSGSAQCPQTGCAQVFAFKDFKHDFFLDQAMLRRIQRAGEAERNRGYDDSRMYDDEDEEEANLISDGAEDEEEEDGGEEAARAARRVSRVPKRERSSTAAA